MIIKKLENVWEYEFVNNNCFFIIPVNPLLLYLCAFPPDHAIRAGVTSWLIN